MFAAARRLARCWRPALVAVRVLMVRSADAQFALKIRSAKHVPRISPLRGQNGMAPLGAGDFFEGEARENRRLASASSARWRTHTTALVSYLLCSQVASCGPMRARCMCVRCPCALHPLTNPFAGCMAGREGCRKARGLEEDGRAVAALPRRDSPCCRTHPQPSHHVKQGWAVRVRGLFLC